MYLCYNPLVTDTTDIKIITEELIEFARSEIRKNYDKNGTYPLSYHNCLHQNDVILTASLMADSALLKGKITEEDVNIINIAAAYHDIIQLLGSGPNENKSSELAELKMSQTGLFTSKQIGLVKAMILSTKITLSIDSIRQSASSDNYFDHLLADADLASLGFTWEKYYYRALALRKEIYGNKITRNQKLTFLQRQQLLLSTHRFYTKEARVLFPHQKTNLTKIEKLIKKSDALN